MPPRWLDVPGSFDGLENSVSIEDLRTVWSRRICGSLWHDAGDGDCLFRLQEAADPQEPRRPLLKTEPDFAALILPGGSVTTATPAQRTRIQMSNPPSAYLRQLIRPRISSARRSRGAA